MRCKLKRTTYDVVAATHLAGAFLLLVFLPLFVSRVRGMKRERSHVAASPRGAVGMKGRCLDCIAAVDWPFVITAGLIINNAVILLVDFSALYFNSVLDDPVARPVALSLIYACFLIYYCAVPGLTLLRLHSTFGNCSYRLARRRLQVYAVCIAVLAVSTTLVWDASLTGYVVFSVLHALLFLQLSREFVGRLLAILIDRNSRGDEEAEQEHGTVATLRQQTISSFERADHGMLRVIAKYSTLVLLVCLLTLADTLLLLVMFLSGVSSCNDNWLSVVSASWCVVCVASAICLALIFNAFDAHYRLICSQLDACLLKIAMYYISN